MENKTVRDTTFRHYFNGGHSNGKSNYRLLSLANTLKGTNYTDPDAIQMRYKLTLLMAASSVA